MALFWSLVFALLVSAAVLAEAGQPIVAATFSDSGCTTLSTNPNLLTSGACTYSTAFKTHYTIIEQPDNQAKLIFGCNAGCTKCQVNATAPFGACVTMVASPSLTIYASAVRYFTNYTFEVEPYLDSNCTKKVPAVSRFDVRSGECAYADSFKTTLVGAYTDPRDWPDNRRVAFLADCDKTCASCQVYGAVGVMSCLKVGSVYVSVNATVSPASDSSSSTPTWEIAAIVAGAVGGIVIIGSVVVFAVCLVRRRHRHQYTQINH